MITSMLRRAQLSGGCAADDAPGQVGGLTATPSGTTTINLAWNADVTAAPNTATAYEVERSVDGLGSWSVIGTVYAPAVTFSDTTLSASTTRHYRVRATNCNSAGLESTSASATTAAPSVNPPAAPSGFTATSSFADSVSLAWTDNSSGSGQETGFEIEVSTNGGTSYSSVTTTAADATSYSHTGRVESQAYLYRIRATNSAGSSSWVTASSVTTPAALTGFTATASSSSAISLSWTDKSGVETGFRIERSTDNVSFSLVTTTAANAVSHSDSGLAASTLYYYRIRSNSYNGTNDSAWYSASATTQSGSSTYNVEYLVVAGGGGGARGGGGAGGYRTATGFTLTPGTSYTITVGAGGAAGATNTQGVNGSDSVFSTITSTGGGGGGRDANGSSGGSGGGGGSNNIVNYNGGAGTSGQGNAGGNQVHLGAPYPSAGGGGASAAGQATQSNSISGNGGDGTASSITGSSITYAGGGGGGTFSGGTNGSGGGGGGGAGTTSGTAGGGTANRGGGGGGTGSGGTAGSGGSGVVVLRMPTANYSGSTTGSPTVTTSGSDTILTYNASGTYTA